PRPCAACKRSGRKGWPRCRRSSGPSCSAWRRGSPIPNEQRPCRRRSGYAPWSADNHLSREVEGKPLSLRMNLYGWNLPSFTQALGSKDAAVLEGATARLAQTVQEGPALSRAKAWLQTLISSGFPLRADREPPPEAADGGLLTVLME